MSFRGTRGAKQSGFTLPELLIALVLGLSLVGAVMSAYLTALKSSGDNNEQAQLTHNLRASLDLVLNDLKRAGANANTAFPASSDAFRGHYKDSPFIKDKNNLQLGGNCAANVCDCVIYSFDADKDGAVGVGTSATNLDVANGETDKANEQFGFRLSNDQRIQLRKGRASSSVSSFSCDAGGGSWESLTEDDVTITQFAISYIDADGAIIAEPEAISLDDGLACNSGDTCIAERNLQVTISGTKDEFSLTVTGKVRVRNDRYFIKP